MAKKTAADVSTAYLAQKMSLFEPTWCQLTGDERRHPQTPTPRFFHPRLVSAHRLGLGSARRDHTDGREDLVGHGRSLDLGVLDLVHDSHQDGRRDGVDEDDE